MMPLFTKRAQTLIDLYKDTSWLFYDGVPPIDSEARPLLDNRAHSQLNQFRIFLETAPDGHDYLDNDFKGWLKEQNIKMGEIGPAIRAALTGTKNAPAIIDIIAGLGRAESKKRLKDVCQI